MTYISSRLWDRIVSLTGLLLLCAPTIPASAQQVDYNRAERFLTWHTERMISGDVVDPTWMEDNNRFWYRNNTGEGFEFVLVDPVRNTHGPLFDRHRLASAMSLAADTSFTGIKLPFQSFDFVGDETRIAFNANKKRFECDIRAYACTLTDTLPDARAFSVSRTP